MISLFLTTVCGMIWYLNHKEGICCQAYAMSEPVIDTASWLAHTRLRPPQQYDIVPRERVQELIRAAVVQRRLTLLAAPAGSGKTTLLADLPHLFPDLPLAWLSLDAADDDPARFLATMVAALAYLCPGFGKDTRALLAARAGPFIEGAHAQAFTTALINDIGKTLPDPFLLVLDDLHLIESPAVYHVLDQLIAQMPTHMRLLIGTRHDPPLPLARLRARRQLAEIRLAELRFRDDEASALLIHLVGGELSTQDIATIQERTEGWGAGLCLLAASLLARDTPTARSTLIDTLAQTDRYLFEFLADEVLGSLPQPVQTFLIETAILHELTPERCRAVTGNADAAALLDEIYRRNLFLTIVGEQQRTVPEMLSTTSPSIAYRYHALFHAFLHQRLARLSDVQVAELHRRAAETQPGSEQAIEHYLAAQLWQQASIAITQAGGRLLRLGQLETLRRWIAAVPAPVYDAVPALLFFDGIATMLQGAHREAMPVLERARQRSIAQGNTHVENEALGALATCAYWQGDFDMMKILGDAALTGPVRPLVRVQLLMSRASQTLFTGDWQRAATDLDDALTVTRHAAQTYLFGVLLFNCTPWIIVVPGRLTAIERFCAEVGAVAEGASSLLQAALLQTHAFMYLWRGQLDQAITASEAILARKAQLSGHFFLIFAAYTTLVDAHIARGAYAEAERCVVELATNFPSVGPFSTILMYYRRARLYLLQGRIFDARNEVALLDTFHHPPSAFATAARTILEGLLAQADGRFGDAEHAFRTAVALEQTQPIIVLLGSTRLLLARLILDQGHSDAALDELCPVLATCAQQDIAGPVLLHGALVVPLLQLACARNIMSGLCAQLLGQLGASLDVSANTAARISPGYQAIPGTPELLSPREVEVLQLMIAGASNRAIAEALVISDATAKTHVAHILQKFGVSSRTLAIARARELRLG